MLIYSSLLNINSCMTKDDFVELVIRWNNTSIHEENIIKGLKYTGERNISCNNGRLSLNIAEYSSRNIIAVRYQKLSEDGAIWNTDYIMNFDDMRLSVILDRSYTEDASLYDTSFSTPHFVSMLAQEGYLKNDGKYPVTNRPVIINEINIDLLSDVVSEKAQHKLPVVYVSKTAANEDPVDVNWLASKLKGIAHVLVQESRALSDLFREACDSKNEYLGAIGIYFPNDTCRHSRCFYHRNRGYDDRLLEKVIKAVMVYSNLQNIDSIYTWNGVRSALLNESLKKQHLMRIKADQQRIEAENRRNRAEKEKEKAQSAKIEAEKEREKAKNEVADLYDTFDDDFKKLENNVKELSNENESLRQENAGLRRRLECFDHIPLLYYGKEQEFYDDEIKEIVLSVLDEGIKNVKIKSRRSDVILDILESNEYSHLSEERGKEIKALLKGHNSVTKPMLKELEKFGFVISEDGKHYKLTYFGDGRYWTSVSKTPSDHKTGKNAAHEICRNML